MSIDPHLRVRAKAERRRHAVKKTLSNTELLDLWMEYEQDKLAPGTILEYATNIRDAIAYIRDKRGKELRVSKWKPDHLWDYVEHVDANYCTAFRPVGSSATCRKKVWVGGLPAKEAVGVCSDCDLFQSPPVYNRLYGIVRWFKWLTRGSVIEANFVRDITMAVRKDAPHRGDHEKRRNPKLEEMRLLVNGTIHPRNRAFYAASAYWWCRPNEMFILDRFASFGLPSPTGVEPPGFEEGFQAHPHLKNFEEGGNLVYIPKVKGTRDKRKWNRWLVIPPELRPILKAYFDWRDKHVQREEVVNGMHLTGTKQVGEGVPCTTVLWITERGTPLVRDEKGRLPCNLYEDHFFYKDCERLGLMKPGDRENPLRVWTAYVQHHFGEQLAQVLGIPDIWAHHFRGDKINKGERGTYHLPKPELVEEMHRKFILTRGFLPFGLVSLTEGQGRAEA